MAVWEMFEKLYAVERFEGYTEKEIEFLVQIFDSLPKVLEDFYLRQDAQRNFILCRTIGCCRTFNFA